MREAAMFFFSNFSEAIFSFSSGEEGNIQGRPPRLSRLSPHTHTHTQTRRHTHTETRMQRALYSRLRGGNSTEGGRQGRDRWEPRQAYGETTQAAPAGHSHPDAQGGEDSPHARARTHTHASATVGKAGGLGRGFVSVCVLAMGDRVETQDVVKYR